jgi:hypothetical protein
MDTIIVIIVKVFAPAVLSSIPQRVNSENRERCYAMLCYAMSCYAMLCYDNLFSAVDSTLLNAVGEMIAHQIAL